MKNFDTETHFRLLRTALARELRCRTLGGGVYAVTSHSRKKDGAEHRADARGETCTCEARVYCTHLALAIDRHMTGDEVEDATARGYADAASEDLKALRLRILRAETTAEDREYIDWSVSLYVARAMRAALEDGAVLVVARPKKVERVRGSQIRTPRERTTHVKR